MTVLGAYVAAVAAISRAVAPGPVPARVERYVPVPQYRGGGQRHVEVRLPCPACGVDVDWIGSCLEPGGATGWRFGGLCRCMIDDGVPA